LTYQQPEATTAKKRQEIIPFSLCYGYCKTIFADKKIFTDKYKNEFSRQQPIFGMYDSYVKEEYKQKLCSL
jgi:hypothetical protein